MKSFKHSFYASMTVLSLLAINPTLKPGPIVAKILKS